MKKWLIRLAILVALGAGAYAFQMSGLIKNSPEKNYKIQQQAYQERMPSKCNQIIGPSYTIASDGSKVTVSQTEARRSCHDSLNRSTADSFENFLH